MDSEVQVIIVYELCYYPYILLEYQFLMQASHPNLVELSEVIREKESLHLVFEHMEGNLYQFMKQRQSSFSERETLWIM